MHGAVSDHGMPDGRRSARTATSSRGRAAPLHSASDGRPTASDSSGAVSSHSSASRYGVSAAEGKRTAAPPAEPPARRGLNESQAALYTALFGVAPPAWPATGEPPAVSEATAMASDGSGRCCSSASATQALAGPDAPMLTEDEQSKLIQRAVRKAMRGAAIERQQAVDAALASARERHEVQLQETLASLNDEKEGAVAAAAAEAAAAAARDREDLARELSREKAAAVSRAVDAAEKAHAVTFRKAMDEVRAEGEAQLEAAQRDREAAVRKVQRAKDAAVAEALKTAREKIKTMELQTEKAAEAERERIAKVERAARSQASKKAEMLNERTWAEAEQLKEQAVAAARAELTREHRREVDSLKMTHEAERAQLRAETVSREQEAIERADERLARAEDRFRSSRAEVEATHRAAIDAMRAAHAEELQAVREETRESALAEAAANAEAQVNAAVAAAKREADREKRTALRQTAAEAEKALRKVMEAAALQQAQAVAAARREFEEELLRDDE